MAGQKLVKHCTKPVNVCRGCESCVVAGSLFRRHVAWRPQNFLRARDGALCLDQPRESEVGKMRFTFLIKQNVTRLDVALQDTALMRIVDRACHFSTEFRCATDPHRLSPGHFFKLTALDKVHAEVAVTVATPDFVNWDNAWMV